MPSRPPPGDPAPVDGALPASATAVVGTRPFGVYVHVPFCATRCGYCDFNTYTADELGPGTGTQAYLVAARAELALAARVLGRAPGAATVFLGGGTPTLLTPAQLAGLLDAVRDHLGVAAGAEVSVEANPETLTPAVCEGLAAAGVTRVSMGMQSAVPHVLATLDRRHTPGRVGDAVHWLRAAGVDQVSLDLIYGTPGESLADWQASLDAALAVAPDHLSAYALVIEEGTAMAARVARGELAGTDEDDLADKYAAADAAASAAGLGWYEVSNWSRDAASRCAHNLGYWRSDDWWGVGPGAHSHVGGVRWWNVRHPRAYAQRLAEGASPAQARELLDGADQALEALMLGVRLSDGWAMADDPRLAALVSEGLADPGAAAGDRLVLTLRGRLLADHVVRRLSELPP